MLIVNVATYLERQRKLEKRGIHQQKIASQISLINDRLKKIEAAGVKSVKEQVDRHAHLFARDQGIHDLGQLELCVKDFYKLYLEGLEISGMNLKLNLTENATKNWEPLEFLYILQFINEAVSNAVLHSRSPFIFTIGTFTDDTQEIIIHDSGQGFNSSQTRQGGIANMQFLANHLAAQCTVSSTQDIGTKITLQF